MKLVILNGPAGVGKSTVAEKLHVEMPMAFLVNVDAWRSQISQWRENRKESQVLSYKIAVAAIGACLAEGCDVIVDKAILNDNSTLEEIVMTGEKYGAVVYEFILTANKEVVMNRALERGFNPAGLLNAEMVETLWDLSKDLRETRPHAQVIDTSTLSPEEVYERVRKTVIAK